MFFKINLSYNFRYIFVLLFLPQFLIMLSTAAERFSIYKNEDCHKMNNNNKINCKCFKFEITCKQITQNHEKEIKMKLPISETEFLKITCKNIDSMEDYNILPYLNFGDKNLINIEKCPLPATDIFQKLNLTNVKEFLYNSRELETNLKKLHFESLQNLSHLRLNLQKPSILEDNLFDGFDNLEQLEIITQNPVLIRNHFAPLKNLKHLELSINDLEDIPDDIFHQNYKLITLYLRNSKLKYLKATLFENLLNLRNLDLSSNEIQFIDPNAFIKSKNLSVINLNSNFIKELPKQLFIETKNLSIFRLSNNHEDLQTLLESFLANLPALKEINLSCRLEKIPTNTFANSTQLKVLVLSKNHLKDLPENLFADQINLQSLDLSNNLLNKLSENLFANNNKLQTLKLSNNLIKEITSFILKPLISLEYFEMNNNRLTIIDQEAFNSTEKLKRINLQSNQIMLSKAETTESYTPFKMLLKLEKLNLRNNSITNAFFEEIKTMNSLKKLDLSYNKIWKLDLNHLKKLTNSKLEINISNNKVSAIELDITQNQEIEQEHTNGQLILNLNGNPLNCDCHLMNFVQYLNAKNVEAYATHSYLITDQLRCSKPMNLENKLVQELLPDQLLCHLQFCSKDCICFDRPFNQTLILDCSNANKTLMPDLKNLDLIIRNQNMHIKIYEVNMENNFLRQLPNMTERVFDKITKLRLSGNKLKEIQTDQIPKNLTHLDLSNNEFSMLNGSFLMQLNKSRTLNSFYLYNNPWKCDCSLKPLLEYINDNFKILGNLSTLRCSQPYYESMQLQKLIISDICPVNMEITIFLTIITILFVLVCVLVFIYAKYEMELKVWLYAHKMCLWFVTEKELDKYKDYDAFISYSSKDEDFVVHHLVPILETRNPPFKLCVHYRHFLAGQNIGENIANAVENSRRTIIVLTKNFIESTWAIHEFRIAHLAALEEKKPKVIVILCGDIEKSENLDADLRAYLNTKTYLKWNEPMFMERLLDAMPPLSNTPTKELKMYTIRKSYAQVNGDVS